MDPPRYSPGEFLHNGRVACALLPSLLVFSSLGGRLVVGILTVGSMVSYIMDALQLREGACTTMWLMLFFSNVSMTVNVLSTAYEQPTVMLAGAILSMWAVVLVTFAWATLQFRWIQMKHPVVTLAFERLVISGSFPVATTALTIGVASLAPLSSTPFYVLVLAAGLYYTLCRPLPSSFQTPQRPAAGAYSKAVYVQSNSDGFWSAILLVTLPTTLYAAIHWTVLLRHMIHVWSLLLLLSLPILFICSVPSGLWWLPGPPSAISTMRSVWLACSLGATIIAFEGRVIFHTFGEYIKLQPPWNWLAVTVALVGFALLAMAQVTGTLNPSADITLAGTCLLLCTTAGSLAAGVPFTWLPAPLVAACGLALYYDTRSLREYCTFVGGALITAAWFLYSHFWFLEFNVQGVSIHNICKMALAAVLPALLVPALIHAKAPRALTGGLLAVQAGLITALEDILFTAGRGFDPETEDESMYPPYLVVATSLLGLVVVRRLKDAGCCHVVVWWLTTCVYASKLMVLLLPMEGVVASVLPLALAATAPIMLLDPEPPATGTATSSARRRPPRLPAKLARYHAILVVLTVAHARFAIFDMVQWLGAARPSEGLLVGALVLTTAAAWAPLVSRLPNNSTGKIVFRRLLAAAGAVGVMMVILQPPMPIEGGARCPPLPFGLCPRLWDERHIPLHDADDVMIWGTGLGRRMHWPRWLLVIAACIAMAAYPAVNAIQLPMPRSAGFTVVNSYCGALVGTYVVVELLPGLVILPVLVCFSCIFLAALLSQLRPSAFKAPGFLPYLLLAWAGVWAFAFLIEAALSLPPLPHEMRRLYPDESLEVEDEREEAVRGGLMAMAAAHSLLLAFALKLKVASIFKTTDHAALSSSSATAVDSQGFPLLPTMGRGKGFDFFCGIVPSSILTRFGSMLRLEGAAAVRMQRLEQQNLFWVPTAGNVLTLAAFLMALQLARMITGQETPEAIFTLAPLLLLLHQDPFLFPVLGEGQRYFPPAVAVFSYLSALAASDAVVALFTDPDEFGMDELTAPWVYGTKNLLLVSLTLPNHIMFLRHLWSSQKSQGARASLLLLFAPLNLLALWLGDTSALHFLAGSAIVVALLQYFSTRHMQHMSMRLI